MDKDVQIDYVLEDLGLDVECIVGEILSILLNTDRRKTHHESLSMLIVLFEQKFSAFWKYFAQSIHMRVKRIYIDSLTKISAYCNEKIMNLSRMLISGFNALMQFRACADKTINNTYDGIDCDTVVRCAQMFSEVFAKQKATTKRQKKCYPESDELFARINSQRRNITTAANTISIPAPTDVPVIIPHNIQIKNTLGLEIRPDKPQLRVIKKKKQRRVRKKKTKTPKKAPKRKRPPSPPLKLYHDIRPKIKMFNSSKWNEDKALNNDWSIDINPKQIKTDSDLVCDPDNVKAEGQSSDNKWHFVLKKDTFGDLIKQLNEFDDGEEAEADLFVEEEHLDLPYPGSDRMVLDKVDEDEHHLVWHRNKYMAEIKSKIIPVKNPLLAKDYRKIRCFSIPRESAKILQRKPYREPGTWQPKYGRFGNQFVYRRPHMVANNFEYPHIRRPTGQQPPELTPTELMWNLRKWSNLNYQPLQN